MGSFGEPLGRLWEALGMLWKALGRRWEALGGFGDARHPSPNKTIYKNVGSTQTPDKPALLAQCYSNIVIFEGVCVATNVVTDERRVSEWGSEPGSTYPFYLALRLVISRYGALRRVTSLTPEIDSFRW